MTSPDEGDQRGRRLPPTDSDLSHITWTQIGTALNTVGVFLALGIAGLALGEALSKNPAAPVAATPPPPAAAPARAPNSNWRQR